MEMGASKENPVPLQEWVNSHEPRKELFYSGGYWGQIFFVRDRIRQIFVDMQGKSTSIVCDCDNVVIGTHTSKSVLLPVFRVTLLDGSVFVMRNNFYDWKVSVEAPEDVEADFSGLFDPNDHISSSYCDGFPDELVYGPYAKDKRRFTIELPNEYYVFAFFWIYARWMARNRKAEETDKK